MRLALLSDVHANREALEACLRHARERGAERIAFLGDLVGYGGDPGPVVERCADEVARGAWAIAGNHDQAALGKSGSVEGDALASAEWTARALNPAQRAFLAGLPMTHVEDKLLLVHASAHRSAEWPYIVDPLTARDSLVAAPQATHTFVGHNHDQRLYHLGSDGRAHGFRPTPGVAIPVPTPRRWLAVVGSVGQPRDRNPAAAYALFDAPRKQLTFFRVPYDTEKAAARVRAQGLPESETFARRLEDGH